MLSPIAIVNSSGQLGGAELSILPVIERLASERRVVVLLPGTGTFKLAAEQAGAEIHEGFGLSNELDAVSGTYGAALRPGLLADAARQQARALASFARLRPAAVYCNGFRAQVAATVPARVAAAPVVWHVRDFARPAPLGSIWASLARGAAVILANSYATGYQPALSAVRHRISVVYPGVDLERFKPRPGEPHGPPTVGMAAHLTPWKGHIRFLDLVRDLVLEGRSLQVRIAGSAIYSTSGHAGFASQIEQEISRRGLAGICCVEAVAHEAMPEWLRSLHVLVHCPDRPEPFGRVIAEALAVGVPVVSSSGGGAPEALGNAGIVVPAGDHTALCDAVRCLLDDGPTRSRLARIGPERVDRLFDQRTNADAVADAILATA